VRNISLSNCMSSCNVEDPTSTTNMTKLEYIGGCKPHLTSQFVRSS